MDTSTVGGWSDLFRLGKRFRGISSTEIAQLISFLTGSLGEFLDHNYESEKMKTLFLANNVYGKHGGPYQPGTAIGLLFHLLSGGEHVLQGFYGHVMGGMSSITQALARAGQQLGVAIRTSASVAHIEVRKGRAYSVVLEDGTEIRGRLILSNADPKRTFLKMVAARELPEDFLFAVRGIKMDGPCSKVACQPVAYRTPKEKPDFTSLPEFPYALDPLQLTRKEMADYAVQARDIGINFIGACCGTVAMHIREMARVLGKLPEDSRPGKRAVRNRCRPTNITTTTI
jgi:Homocysteine S-methyltransferase